MNEQTLWILLTVVGIAGAAVLGLALKKLNDGLKTFDEQFQAPQLRFRYTANDVADCLDKLSVASGKPFDDFSRLMLAMMAEVLLVLMVVSHNITDMKWLEYTMFAFSGVIWLTGSIETLIVKKQPKAASLLSLVKWSAFALWTLGMFAGLFIRSTAL